MTKITSTTSTPSTIPVDTPQPETKAKVDTPKKESAPESTAKDTWEAAPKQEKSEGFFSKIGQKINQAIDETISDVKDTRKTVNTLQNLDAQTVKDIAKQALPNTIQSTVKDVVTVVAVASEAIEKQQEIKKSQNEALIKGIKETINYAPELLQEVKQTTQSIADKTNEILEKYTPDVIQETRKTIENDQLGFLESVKELATATPQVINELRFNVSATTGKITENLQTELEIAASSVVANHVDTIRAAIELPTLKELLFTGLKANTPEKTHALLDTASLMSGGFAGIVQTQIQTMLRSTAHALVDTAIKIDADPEAHRTAKDYSANIRALEVNEEFIVESKTKVSGHVHVGIDIGLGVNMMAKRDKNNPTDILIQVSHNNTYQGGVGEEAASKGVKADIGGKTIDSLTFRFDSTNPKHMQLMDKLVYAHRNGLPLKVTEDVLKKHINEISGSAGVILSGSADFIAADLSADVSAMVTQSKKTTDEGVENTFSVEIGQINQLGTPRMQLPDSVGIFDRTHVSAGENSPMDIYNAIMSNSSSLGVQMSGEVTAKAGVTFKDDSQSLDDLKSIFIEASGTLQFNADSLSATARTEILNPAELVRHLNTTQKDLVRDINNGTLTMDNIIERLTSEGVEIGNFIKVGVTTQSIQEDVFALDAGIFDFKSGKRTIQEKEYAIFPPESDTPKSPQQLTQKDAAEASLRLLDRAFHA